ncbi:MULTISPECIES: hypothetical protein [Methylobacterium]|jgi:hypothetical protein|uniref:Uncharacterized protein n=1 Tax=Methylobacterium hispanicum TaxID=270350 RepID=A0AAV4ZMH8_9HYPH|nr:MULTISPECIES: hypothetical protein [Methylobacterium]GJD89751.1 hypothetical protein BHAOGJBA_3281 [Methylobacterium hispanicum]
MPTKGKRSKRQAYLVAVAQRREAARIYAVVAASEAEALAALGEHAVESARLQVVGGLSRDMVRRLKLKPGELRLV